MKNSQTKTAGTALILASVSLLISVFNAYQREMKMPGDKVVVAGTIRNTGDRGWFVLDDESHAPINISRVEVKKGVVIVYFPFRASKIHTFVVTPDETFGASGYFVGASVRKGSAAILVSKVVDGKAVPINASDIKSQIGNFWIYGLFTLE